MGPASRTGSRPKSADAICRGCSSSSSAPGIARTFLYELYDFPDSGSYGLIHADGAPKPAFDAVKALLHLLADPGPPITPQPLAYGITHGGGDVRHVAFQKRDGRYLVAFWHESAELRRAGPA